MFIYQLARLSVRQSVGRSICPFKTSLKPVCPGREAVAVVSSEKGEYWEVEAEEGSGQLGGSGKKEMVSNL